MFYDRRGDYLGGTTIIKIGKTAEEVLERLKKSVLDAVPTVYPDSDAAILNPSTNIGKAYELEIVWENNAPKDVKFTMKGDKGNVGMPISVAKLFGPPTTKENPWIGCVHLHT